MKNVIDKAVQKNIPKKTRKSGYKKKKPLWWNQKIERVRRSKYNLWKRYQESKEYRDYVDYKRALNKATKVVRQSQKKYERKLAKNVKTNPKSFYAYAD